MSTLKYSICFLFFVCTAAFSQTVADSSYLIAFDKQVGQDNSGIYNGTQFNDRMRSIDNTTRYFTNPQFIKGSVVYDGLWYGDILMKYDLLEDQLIIRSDDNLSGFYTKPLPSSVSSFYMYGSTFVRLTDPALKSINGNGFYEKAYKGEKLTLYIKHKKIEKQRTQNTSILYTFIEDPLYVLHYKDQYFVINSINDCKRAIPEKEKQIKEFYNTYKQVYKENPSIFMVRLFKTIDGSLTIN